VVRHKNMFCGTTNIQKSHIGQIFGVPGYKWRCEFFFVSTDTLGLRRFGGRPNSPAFTNQNELLQDELGWLTIFESNNCCRSIFLHVLLSKWLPNPTPDVITSYFNISYRIPICFL